MGEAPDLHRGAAVVGDVATARRCDRQDRAEVAGAEPPQMHIDQRVAVALDRRAQSRGQPRVRVHVEQHRAGVADQAGRPTDDDAGADQAGERVHPQPAEAAGQQQADDDQDRHRRVGHDVHHRRAQIVVAMDGIMGVAVIGLGEGRLGDACADAEGGDEFMRLGDRRCGASAPSRATSA